MLLIFYSVFYYTPRVELYYQILGTRPYAEDSLVMWKIASRHDGQLFDMHRNMVIYLSRLSKLPSNKRLKCKTYFYYYTPIERNPEQITTVPQQSHCKRA